MPTNVSEWLGVCAFVLAVLSLVFQYYAYRHQRRSHEEEAREQVEVHPRFQISMEFKSPLVVTVINTGRIPVPVKRVELQCGPEELRTGESIMSIPLTVVGGVPSPVIDPGQQVEFFLPGKHPLIRVFAEDPARVRLVVFSNRGEIARIAGKEVATYLREM